ncbi:MAG: GNAT family N-acetyltransferase [Candidatus Limnocylindria bacterium]
MLESKPNIGVVIRDVRPDEFDAVGELSVRAFREIFDDLDEYEAVLRDVADRARQVEVLVAEVDRRPVGTVTYVPRPGPYAEGDETDAGWVRILAVSPDYQRRGIAAALVAECVARARRDGRRRLLLHTTAPMQTAQRLYERLGFSRLTELDWEAEPGFWLYGYAYGID